jgi:hypothetical protein
VLLLFERAIVVDGFETVEDLAPIVMESLPNCIGELGMKSGTNVAYGFEDALPQFPFVPCVLQECKICF